MIFHLTIIYQSFVSFPLKFYWIFGSINWRLQLLHFEGSLLQSAASFAIKKATTLNILS